MEVVGNLMFEVGYFRLVVTLLTCWDVDLVKVCESCKMSVMCGYSVMCCVVFVLMNCVSIGLHCV